ncbi:site-specific integrase [Chitinibacter sp. ZOR0017]|uniref:site-specific integrase n=1 Tax=Chitinibacter sp. ZOR0017 TaxID=1339254 RepID=UPI0009DF5470|nr:site-specific integrase [Chitinibacter sp. ZOR0017]
MGQDKTLKPDSHVVKRPERSKNYYFRMEIPKDVRAAFGGKREFEKSLKTADVREANRLAAPIRTVLYQQIDAARKAQISPDDLPLESLQKAWVHQLLADDEQSRSMGLSECGHEALSVGLDIEKAEVSKGLALGRTPDYLKKTFTEFLASHGLNVPEGTPARARLEYRLLQAHQETLHHIGRRQQGSLVPTPEQPKKPEGVANHGLMAILAKYQNERRLADKIYNDAVRHVKAFIAICGDKPVRKYTKQDGIKFKEALLERDLHPSTINSKYLGWINVLLNWAAQNDYLDVNLLSAIKVKEGKVQKVARLPYDENELRVIFSSPIYKGGKVPTGGKGSAAFWLPLLGLFTGARLEELAQLQPSDVIEDPLGVYIFIADYKAGSGVKTNESRRRVPLHPELLRIGFQAYWRSVQHESLLFPLLKVDSKGDISGHWSKWWGRWCRQSLGITDTRKVFHSFRHGFKHLCREAGITEEVHDALTGHAGGTVSRNYKDTFYPLPPLFEAIARLTAPIDLTGIKWKEPSDAA